MHLTELSTAVLTGGKMFDWAYLLALLIGGIVGYYFNEWTSEYIEIEIIEEDDDDDDQNYNAR